MLNFIYYPVSAILWFWHQVFGWLLGATNGLGWALAVIFLVFTLRALLFKPFVSQVRSMRKMQEFSPQIKKLQEKYKNDRQKQAEEMQKLQKEHGVNPLGGCLPVLVQLPVFIGLFHVLRGFRADYAYNYVFSREDILTFLQADLFGVRLNDAIAGSMEALGAFSFDLSTFRAEVVPVALPLMIVSSVATHFTARVSQNHQSAAAAANPQAAIMAKVTMYLFPFGILVFGVFFPIAILLYWLSNNTWTLGQQYFVYSKIDREEREKKDQAREQRDQLGPRPGQKPARQRSGDGDAVQAGRDTAEPVDVGADDPPSEDAASPAPASGNGSGARSAPGKVNGKASGKGSGTKAPGKVGAKDGGKPGGGAPSGKGGAKSGGKAGGGKAGGAPSGKGGGSGGSGQLASSGRSGKRSKKRR